MWYCAHIVMLMAFDEEEQDVFPFWENVVLVEADSEEEAFEKAEALGRIEEKNSGPIIVDDRPAKFVFSGVRKAVLCGHTGEKPREGQELTFSSFECRDRENFDKFVGGDYAELSIRTEFRESD